MADLNSSDEIYDPIELITMHINESVHFYLYKTPVIHIYKWPIDILPVTLQRQISRTRFYVWV